MSTPSSAPIRAACLTYSTSCSDFTFAPLGYIMARRGIPQPSQVRATLPRSWSIVASSSAPTLTWMLTASAPTRMASSTSVTRTLWLGSGPRLELADRWTISPTSRPYPRWPKRGSPMWPRTAFAPPSATLSTAPWRSISPSMGPTVRPWSMGTMTVRPVLLLKILSILMDFPTFLMGEGH
ncbi:MAG: hypothetical protein A4E51_01703 [Methanosaeta sp. PtaU1.Bin055]|nr:MAG: hypothetical protein A4E51_01703 [Methanosaeta sp. PtaU1.Bin055]